MRIGRHASRFSIGRSLRSNLRSIRFRVVRRSNNGDGDRNGHRKIDNENDWPKILALFGL